MTEVLVWVLIVSSWNGGMLKVENIRSWEDCERLRTRAEQSSDRRNGNGPVVAGACTQVGILVPTPTASVVNVQPTPVTIQNTVVVKKAKK